MLLGSPTGTRWLIADVDSITNSLAAQWAGNSPISVHGREQVAHNLKRSRNNTQLSHEENPKVRKYGYAGPKENEVNTCMADENKARSSR